MIYGNQIVEATLGYRREHFVDLLKIRQILNLGYKQDLDRVNPVFLALLIFKVYFMVYVGYCLAHFVASFKNCGKFNFTFKV